MARLFKTPITVEGAVTSNGLVLSSTTSPITLNGQVGTTGQVLTSAGAGATPTWTTVSGGSASNSFATISTPSGTSPVADSSTDTLTFTAGTGITITGDSAADSIAIATNGATANGASTLILRDASGGFAAGAITGISFNSITGLSSTTPAASGTAAVGTATTAARADHVHAIPTSVAATVTSNSVTDIVSASIADNDYFRIRVGGTGTNAGFVEIATADDGTEPIHVRQYTGVFTTLARTATLLDGSGNTSFPGAVTATSLTTTGSVTTGAALNLNYGSPTIASSNASTASIFTTTVTGVTIGSSTIKTTAFPAETVAATSATTAGYIGIPQNSKSGAYTLVAGDAGEHIYYTVTGQTVTIPNNTTVAFQIGTTITFITAPSVSLSIAITTDTMYLAGAGTTGTRTLAALGMATAVKITSTSWIISGNGLT